LFEHISGHIKPKLLFVFKGLRGIGIVPTDYPLRDNGDKAKGGMVVFAET
jgi:hypothetical protein